MNDLYLTGSHRSSTVVLFVRESISFWVPSSPMESSCKYNTLNDVFLSNISANTVAPSTPTGLPSSSKFCSVSFVHRALANWHAPSESMSHCGRLRSTRVWFVLSTEASEMVFWREKCENHMINLLSVVLWWSPLMISLTASGGRSLWLMPSSLRLVDDDSSSLRAWQSSTPIPVLPNSSFSSE